MWRRLRLVPWDVTIRAKSATSIWQTKLGRPRPPAYSRLVEGARIYLADGLSAPEAVRAATDGYRTSEDTVGQFLADVLTFTPDSQVSVRRR